MTDGPFRNAKLPWRWKRYGEDLVNDATSQDERVVRACHSMLGDVVIKDISSLLRALSANAQRIQMDLDPVSSTEAIFYGYPKSPLTDTLQKHLIANLRARMSPEIALNQALKATTEEWIRETKNRIADECIRVRDIGDMTREEYRQALGRNRDAFAAVNLDAICDALLSGKKGAFKSAVRKKSGVDEGPDE